VSTFDTDYILVRAHALDTAIDSLRRAGHLVVTMHSWRTAVSAFTWAGRFAADGQQVARGPDVPSAIDRGRRRQRLLTQPVHVQQLEIRSRTCTCHQNRNARW
jgi:hypothetical protein